MAKVTFVYPDFESLGVEYLMSCCMQEGHEVSLIYYEAEDSILGIKKSNISYANIVDKIIETGPDIVAFSCVTDNFRYQLACCTALKERDEGVCTIFGGIHPTAVPKKVLRNDVVDAVAIGEAEHSFLEFILKYEKAGFSLLSMEAIDGIVFKRNGGEEEGKFQEGNLADLDKLPLPYKVAFRKVLEDASYEYRIITSRGCPYRCSYCFNSQSYRKKGKLHLRQRSVHNVIEELLLAKEEKLSKLVMFMDDSFTTDKKWIAKFCTLYKERIDMPFACAAIPHYITSSVARMLADAGCVSVQLGIQSLSETTCKEILDRPSKNSSIIKAITSLKECGVVVQVDHMLGIPDDTVKIQKNNLLFYNKYRPNIITVFWLTYYPKTSIIDIALKRGILCDEDIAKIENGERLGEGSYLCGGSMKDPRVYYSIHFMMNWMHLLPAGLCSVLIRSDLYRLFSIKNYYISTALPRAILSLLNKRDYRGRAYLVRFVGKVLKLNWLKRRSGLSML